MDHDHIEVNDVVGRYVARRLTDSEAQEFEAHLVDCQTCLDAVEAEVSLRDGLRHVGSGFKVQPPAPAATRSFRAMPAYGFLQAAAAVLLAVSVGLGAWLSRSTAELNVARTERDQLQRRARQAEQSATALERRLADAAPPAKDAPAPRPAPVAPVGVFALTTVRGSSSADAAPVNRVQIDAKATLVVFSLEIAAATGTGDYEVALKDRTGRLLWSGGPFPPSSSDSIGVAIERAVLPAGDYVLELSRRSPAGRTLIGRYSFRISTR